MHSEHHMVILINVQLLSSLLQQQNGCAAAFMVYDDIYMCAPEKGQLMSLLPIQGCVELKPHPRI